MSESPAPTTSQPPAKLPGEVLSDEFLKPRGLSSTNLAISLGVTTSRISEIILGRRRISPETALRLARYFETTAEYWLDLQRDYELSIAREEWEETIEKQIRPHSVQSHAEISPAKTGRRTIPRYRSNTSLAQEPTLTTEQRQEILDSLGLTDRQKGICALLADGRLLNTDQLCALSGLSVEEISSALGLMLLNNLVKQHWGDQWSL